MNKNTSFLLVMLFFGLTSLAQNERDQAINLFNQAKYEEATEAFFKLYKKLPDEVNYSYLLNCYKAKKNYTEAENLIKSRIKKNNDIRLLIDLGYYQLQQKKIEDAKQSFNEVYAQIAKNQGLAYSLSEYFTKYALYNEALTAYEVAEQNNPGMVFHFQKGMLYAELGDLDNMYREYLDLIEQSPTYYQSVRERMARNITTDPLNESNVILKNQLIKKIQLTQNIKYNELLIWLYTEEEQYDKALRQLKAMDKRNENMEASIYGLGEKTLAKGNYNIAIECFDYLKYKGSTGGFYEESIYSSLKAKRKLLENTPNVPTSEYGKLAKEHLADLKIIGQDERLVLIKNSLARILFFNLNLQDSAINMLTSTIAQYTNMYKRPVAEAKMQLGDMLLAQNKSIEAIFKYMEVERTYTDAPLGDEAKFMKGMVAYYTADFDWALSQFEVLKSSSTKLISNDALEMALLISDNSVEDTLYQGLTYYAKADFYYFRNMLDSAYYTLDMLLSVFPDHEIKEEARLLQAKILIQKGDYQQAVDALNTMLLTGGDIWADDALMLLGEVYSTHLNNIPKAMDAYERILFDHTGSIFVPEARRRYRMLRGDNLN